jgi:hypothetical protein
VDGSPLEAGYQGDIRSTFVTEVDGTVFEYDLGTALGPLTLGLSAGAWDMARID